MFYLFYIIYLNFLTFQEFISLTTGFIGFCLFNMIVFLISFLGTLLGDYNVNMGPSLAWQVALAVTPIIWITRNKKIVDKMKSRFTE